LLAITVDAVMTCVLQTGPGC